MKNSDNFNIKEILKKIIEELNIKINSVLKTNPTRKNIHNKKEFFFKEDMHKGFPISRDSYYSYNAFVNAFKPSKNIKSIDLSAFYGICEYTDVSADYLLGFIDSKRKEQSAEMVKKKFGLSDKAMGNLAAIQNRKAEGQGELSSDIINFILENGAFWNKLNERLPVYLTCLDYRSEDIDMDVTRYGIIRAFEELLDELCDNIKKRNMPPVELDETTPFPTLK